MKYIAILDGDDGQDVHIIEAQNMDEAVKALNYIVLGPKPGAYKEGRDFTAEVSTGDTIYWRTRCDPKGWNLIPEEGALQSATLYAVADEVQAPLETWYAAGLERLARKQAKREKRKRRKQYQELRAEFEAPEQQHDGLDITHVSDGIVKGVYCDIERMFIANGALSEVIRAWNEYKKQHGL